MSDEAKAFGEGAFGAGPYGVAPGQPIPLRTWEVLARAAYDGWKKGVDVWTPMKKLGKAIAYADALNGVSTAVPVTPEPEDPAAA